MRQFQLISVRDGTQLPASRNELRDSNQGGEMAIAVAQFQGFDASGARLHNLADGMGTGTN